MKKVTYCFDKVNIYMGPPILESVENEVFIRFHADVNGDGKIDILATRGHGVGVLWFEAPISIDWKQHMIDEIGWQD